MKNEYCRTCPDCFNCELRKNYEKSPGEYALQMSMCRIEHDAKKRGDKR